VFLVAPAVKILQSIALTVLNEAVTELLLDIINGFNTTCVVVL
jgi:hypothetical protein